MACCLSIISYHRFLMAFNGFFRNLHLHQSATMQSEYPAFIILHGIRDAVPIPISAIPHIQQGTIPIIGHSLDSSNDLFFDTNQTINIMIDLFFKLYQAIHGNGPV